MIRFTCGSCGKRFSTTDDPVPGRSYRIRCSCGNTNVVRMDARAETGPPPLAPGPNQLTPTQPASPSYAATDDPFLRAMMMDAPGQDQAPPATTPPAVPLPLARRDPVYAERYDAPVPSDAYPVPSDAYEVELPETTRETRLAGPRAVVLGAAARLREILGAGLPQLLRGGRLVAGGAVVGVFAFGLGVWVGAGSVAARWKAAAEAEARSVTPDASPRSVAAGTVAPVAALVPVEIAERGVPPSGPLDSPAPAQPRDAQDDPPAAVRPAKTRHAARKAMLRAAPEKPAPAQEPTRDEEAVRTADHLRAGGEAPMARSSDGRDAEEPSEPTLTASPDPAPDARAATNPEPTPADPADALPER